MNNTAEGSIRNFWQALDMDSDLLPQPISLAEKSPIRRGKSGRLAKSMSTSAGSFFETTAKNIPDSFKKNYLSVDWRIIAGTRDVLIHAYFGVNIEQVWGVVIGDLPLLKKEMFKIYQEQLKLKNNLK